MENGQFDPVAGRRGARRNCRRGVRIDRRAGARRSMDGKAGDGAALKLLRTLLTKGVEALAVECFVAAESRVCVTRCTACYPKSTTKA